MAIPMFVFMGVVLRTKPGGRRSAQGLADPTKRRVPGGLAMSVALLGHHHGGNHRHRRRIGDDADHDDPANHAGPQLQPRTRNRHHRRFRHARYPDTAIDHAGDFG